MPDNDQFQIADWVQYADDDQKVVELILREGSPASSACFHSQQIAEKYLKGFLIFSRKKFAKSHQLNYLLELCEEIDNSFQQLRDDVLYLTQFYIETRYPGEMSVFSLDEAKKAFVAAMRVKDFVLSKI